MVFFDQLEVDISARAIAVIEAVVDAEELEGLIEVSYRAVVQRFANGELRYLEFG